MLLRDDTMQSTNGVPTSYDRLDTQIGDGTFLRLGSNLYLYRRGLDAVAVRYYETDVVTFTAYGHVELNSGGFLRVKTKEAINSFLPIGVDLWQHEMRWFVVLNAGTSSAQTYRFYDHIVVNITDASDGGAFLVGTYDAADFAEEDAANDATLRAIEKYIGKITPALLEQSLADMTGDCFLCGASMRDGVQMSLGDVTDSHEHLQIHMQRKQYPGKLFVNAYRAHVDNPVHSLALDMQTSDGIKRVRRTLRKYLRERLVTGMAV